MVDVEQEQRQRLPVGKAARNFRRKHPVEVRAIPGTCEAVRSHELFQFIYPA